MSMNIEISFSKISKIEDFYKVWHEKFSLPTYFGDNLDALYDYITAEAQMPLQLSFRDMKIEQLETFSDLIQTMEDAEEATDGFEFSYYLVTYHD